jgi:two-component system nitrate/nitrite response regulator NarL
VTAATRGTVRYGDPLSLRERQVLAGMARGRSNAEIGFELELSVDTVKTHAHRLFIKLGVHSQAGAVGLGFRQGLLPLPSVQAPGSGVQR